MPKDKSLQELISTMRFPLGGIDLSQLPSGQHPGTTAIGQNVRSFEPLTGRGRGGSRPGIAKYIDEQVAGDHYIQHLNYIVTASGEAVGAAFDGVDLGDIGGLAVDNLGGLDANEFHGWGGGGFQPAKPRAALRVVLRITAVDAGGTFTPSSANVPADGTTVTIVATLRDFSGTAQAGDTIVLHTTPPGRNGDGASGVTILDVSDPPLGTVTFTVHDNAVETVIYSASDTTNPTNSVNQVTVVYKDQPPPSLTASTNQAPADGTNVTLTARVLAFNGAPRAGQTIVLSTSPSGRVGDGVSHITDGLGQATFTVNDNTEEDVIYVATNTTGSPTKASAPVAVHYTNTPLTIGVAVFLEASASAAGPGDAVFKIDGTQIAHYSVAANGSGSNLLYTTDPSIPTDSVFWTAPFQMTPVVTDPSFIWRVGAFPIDGVVPISLALFPSGLRNITLRLENTSGGLDTTVGDADIFYLTFDGFNWTVVSRLLGVIDGAITGMGPQTTSYNFPVP